MLEEPAGAAGISLWRSSRLHSLFILLAGTIACSLTAFAVYSHSGRYEEALLLALATLVGGLAILLFARYPAFGLSAALAVGVLTPALFDFGTGSRVNSTVLVAPLAIAGCLIAITRRRQRALISVSLSKDTIWALLLVLAFALALGIAQISVRPPLAAALSAQLGGFGIVLISVMLFFAASNCLGDLHRLRFVVKAFLLAAGVRVACLYLPGQIASYGRGLLPESPLGSMFWTWVVAMAFGQLLANRALTRLGGFSLLALTGASVYITFFPWREWLSGWLPGMVAMWVILILSKPRLGAALTVFGMGLLAFRFEPLLRSIWTSEQQYSLFSRADAAGVLFKLIKANPILGLGPANYYHQTTQYPLYGWYVNFSSHNTYLDILLQAGIIGFVFFGLYIAGSVSLALRLRRTVPQGFPLGYVYGVIGGLAGTLCAAALGDWVLPFAYNVGLAGLRTSIAPWVFLGGLVAVGRMNLRSAAHPRREASK